MREAAQLEEKVFLFMIIVRFSSKKIPVLEFWFYWFLYAIAQFKNVINCVIAQSYNFSSIIL